MSATPHANGGVLTRDLDLPDFRDYAIDVPRPAFARAESTRKLGELIRDIYTRNDDRFRLFCPDETNSNRLGSVFEVSDRAWAERVTDDDVALSRDGRVMEVLSEHNCHGWLEGYTLDRPPRHVRDVRGVRHGQRVADDPAQQVARGGDPPAVAGAGAVAERPAHVDRVAQRPQRLLPPGTWPDPERDHDHVATSAGSICRPTRTACCRWPITASAPGRT